MTRSTERRSPVRPTSAPVLAGGGGGSGVPPTRTLTVSGADGIKALSTPQTLAADRTFTVGLDPAGIGALKRLSIGDLEVGPLAILSNAADGSLLVNGSPVGGGLNPASDQTITGQWSFSQPLGVAQATGPGHAVAAARSILTPAASGATLGFGLAGGGNLTADRSLTVVPPQDLRTTANPEFSHVILGSQTTAANHAVRADRALSIGGTTNQVKVGGSYGVTPRDLTADRTWTLSLPQDIHTAATPQFGRLGLGVAADPTRSLLASGGAGFGGIVGSSTYDFGLSGWHVTAPGVADFRTIHADQLFVKVFVADVTQALGGSDFLTKSFGVLSRDFTVPAVGAWSYLYVEDLPGLPDTQVFASGDTVRLRVYDRSGGGLTVADVWGRVTSYADQAGKEQRWVFTTLQVASGAAGYVVREGMAALDYGVSGDGLIERTVLGAGPYSRTVLWHDTNGVGVVQTSGVPYRYEVVTQDGNLAGKSTANLGNLSGFGFYGNRLFLEAGASWMRFDGAFSMSTPNLSVSPSGTLTLGSDLVFASPSPIIDAINGSGLTINAARVSFTAGSVPVAAVSGLGSLATASQIGAAQLDSTVISGGYIRTALLDANAIVTNAGTITNTLRVGSISTSNPTGAGLGMYVDAQYGDFYVRSGPHDYIAAVANSSLSIRSTAFDLKSAGMSLDTTRLAFGPSSGVGVVPSYGGTGVWIGRSGSVGKLSLVGATNELRWDGSNLLIKGGGVFTGDISGANGNFTGGVNATSGTFSGGITVTGALNFGNGLEILGGTNSQLSITNASGTLVLGSSTANSQPVGLTKSSGTSNVYAYSAPGGFDGSDTQTSVWTGAGTGSITVTVNVEIIGSGTVYGYAGGVYLGSRSSSGTLVKSGLSAVSPGGSISVSLTGQTNAGAGKCVVNGSVTSVAEANVSNTRTIIAPAGIYGKTDAGVDWGVVRATGLFSIPQAWFPCVEGGGRGVTIRDRYVGGQHVVQFEFRDTNGTLSNVGLRQNATLTPYI